MHHSLGCQYVIGHLEKGHGHPTQDNVSVESV